MVNNRALPKNLELVDIELFQNALKITIPEVDIWELKVVTIIKNSLFIHQLWHFKFSLSHILQFSKFKVWRKLYLLPFLKTTIDRACWVIDEWSCEYFHWLTDALPRLQVIEQYIGKFPVLLPTNYKSNSYVLESLEILGVEYIFYNPSAPLKINELFSSSHVAPTGNYNKQILLALKRRMVRNIYVGAEKKIYISRAKSSKRKLINEEEVVTLFSRFGIEVHCFEDYSLDEQIDLMAQTKYLIGLHGAGLTNMIFMNPHGKVLEIRNRGDRHNNAFFALASELDINYYYQLSESNKSNTQLDDFSVDVTDLEKLLVRFLSQDD